MVLQKHSLGIVAALLCTLNLSVATAAEPSHGSQEKDRISVPSGKPTCGLVPASSASTEARITRTFYDNFREHPLKGNRWTPHLRGSAKWPEPLYWGGKNSDIKRRTAATGEQQIYVDPRYRGLADKPLGLDPFAIGPEGLQIKAKRMEERYKKDLFGNEYTSGVLTTSPRFSQKYGYFEVEAKVPAGQGVWPAFWLLPESDTAQAEIDVFEGLGMLSDTLAMTVHSYPGGKHQSCANDLHVSDAATKFHRYGVLWTSKRITFYVDRKPVKDSPTPAGFDSPMYLILNLAMGSAMHGVGAVGPNSPAEVSLQIKNVAAYTVEGGTP